MAVSPSRTSKATEGGDFVDRSFPANWAGATGAGIERGAYHFFTLCTPGRTQAQNFLHAVPDDPGALPAAVDLELAGNCHARPDRGAVISQLTDFLAAVEAVTHKPTVLYLGHDFERRYRVRDAVHRPLWEFRFVLRPGGGWTIWQVDASPMSLVCPAGSTSKSPDDRRPSRGQATRRTSWTTGATAPGDFRLGHDPSAPRNSSGRPDDVGQPSGAQCRSTGRSDCCR
jgi:GH25 family lysozyme M1 (1,4-beta-N-acetylmuramidase)